MDSNIYKIGFWFGVLIFSSNVLCVVVQTL